MELSELVKDAIAALSEGNHRAADSIAREIARLGGTMDPIYKDKVLERIQKLEQDALKYDSRGDTAQASAIVAEVERWRRSLGETTAPTAPGSSADIEKAIERLDPDKYAGTLGLEADAPVSSKWSHNTNWIAANKGAWVRVVSDTTLEKQAVAIGQRWICTTDGTKARSPANWELIQEGEKKVQFATYANKIGTLERTLSSNAALLKMESGEDEGIPFLAPYLTGVFKDFYEGVYMDPYVTNVSKIVFNNIFLNISFKVQCAPDVAGDRTAEISILTYLPLISEDPEENFDFDTFVWNEPIISDSKPTSRTTYCTSAIDAKEYLFSETGGEADKRYGIYCHYVQNSGNTLDLTYGELVLEAWR